MNEPLDNLKTYSVSDARERFADLLNGVAAEPVVINRHGVPGAVIMSYDLFVKLIDQIEDLQDHLSIAERENDLVSMDEAFRLLGGRDDEQH